MNFSSRKSRSRMKGGNPVTDRLFEFLESLKNIFKMSSYYYLFTMLLVISCVFFVFATIIFVNACINLHKTSFVYPLGDSYKKLIDAPIFEYLKTNNFLVIDKFFLNADSSLKPSSVAYWTVVGIMLGVLILILIHYLVLSREINTKQDITDHYNNILKKNFPYLVIAAFPYFFIFIIVITFNSIQVKNMDDLNNINIKDIKEYRKDDLDAIKEKLQEIIYKGDTVLNTAELIKKFKVDLEDKFKIYEKPPINTEAASGAKATNAAEVLAVPIDIAAIVFIYKHNLTSLGKTGDPQYQRKYINYIDEYFNLLKYNGTDDNYTKFYLFGLIEYKDNDNDSYTNNEKMKEYRELIKIKENGDGLEKVLISYINTKIRGYFIAVISLYTILCFFTILILLVFNQDAKMHFVSLLFIINKIIFNKTFLNIINVIAVLLLLVGLIALMYYIVIPQMYKWVSGLYVWYNYTS